MRSVLIDQQVKIEARKILHRDQAKMKQFLIAINFQSLFPINRFVQLNLQGNYILPKFFQTLRKRKPTKPDARLLNYWQTKLAYKVKKTAC